VRAYGCAKKFLLLVVLWFPRLKRIAALNRCLLEKSRFQVTLQTVRSLLNVDPAHEPVSAREVFVTEDAPRPTRPRPLRAVHPRQAFPRQQTGPPGRIYETIITNERRGQTPRQDRPGSFPRHRRNQSHHQKSSESVDCVSSKSAAPSATRPLPIPRSHPQMRSNWRKRTRLVHVTMVLHRRAGELEKPSPPDSVKENCSASVSRTEFCVPQRSPITSDLKKKSPSRNVAESASFHGRRGHHRRRAVELGREVIARAQICAS